MNKKEEEDLRDLQAAMQDKENFWLEPVETCYDCVNAAEGLVQLSKKAPPTRSELEDFVKKHFDYLGELEDFIKNNLEYLQELYQSDFVELADFAKNHFTYLDKRYRSDFV